MIDHPLEHMLLELALLEDLGLQTHDYTSALLFPNSHQPGIATIRSKEAQSTVVCGVSWLATLLKRLSQEAQIMPHVQDGDRVEQGQTLVTLRADMPILLAAERIMLNFLRHLSAIATLTARYVAEVKHTALKILDTRKTTPGMRRLEKYAVVCGGGANHRMGLYDAVMIKDTHVDLLGGMIPALERIPHHLTVPVIVEIRNRSELEDVLTHGQNKVNRVLLDNLSLADLEYSVRACRGIFATEASGNIRLHTVRAIAETGVEYASVGELTYGAGQVDFSMYTQKANS